MIRKADNVAAALQYQEVLSFSLYRSISVCRGCHLGSGGDISVSSMGGLLRVLRQVSILKTILPRPAVAIPAMPKHAETARTGSVAQKHNSYTTHLSSGVRANQSALRARVAVETSVCAPFNRATPPSFENF